MITIQKLNAAYGKRTLFQDTAVTIEDGRLTAICGPSGIGKTTLLNILGLLSGFSDYTYTFNEHLVNLSNEKEKADMRKQNIAYVFQEHNLHDNLTIEENLKLYCMISNHPYQEEKAKAALNQMELLLPFDTKAAVLSGGEYQRLSLACALMKEPQLIIADEVTSALDHENSERIIKLLKDIANTGKMVILATHDQRVLSQCDIIYTIKDQKIVNETLAEAEREDTQSIQKQENVSKTEINHFSLNRFYRWYAKFSLGKSKWEKRAFILLPSVIIFLCLFFIGIKDSMIQHFHDSLNAYGMNEVYISGQRNITDHNLNKLKAIEGVEDVALFSPRAIDYLQVDDASIALTQTATVVPYFPFQNNYLEKEQTKDAYLSYYLAERYQIKKGSTLHIKEGDLDLSIKVGGILEQDVQLVQGSSSLYMIYIPQAIYPTADKAFAVVHLRDFEAFDQITDKIYDFMPSCQVVLAQSDYLTQMESMDQYSGYLEVFITSLLVLTILFLSVSQYFAVKNCKYEISVLRANGLSRKEVSHVIIHIFADDMIKTGVLVAAMLFVAKIIAILMGNNIFIFTPFMIVCYLLMVVGTYVIPVLLTLWIMLRMNIEKMLRT